MTRSINYTPYIIIVVFVLFGAFIGNFVYQSTLHDTHLVTEDYYQDEVNFQQRINESQNALEIDQNFSFHTSDGILTVNFPERWEKIQGKAHLYNARDSKQDVQLPFVTASNVLKLKTDELGKGFWTLKLSFTYNETPYYIERKVYL